MPIYVQKCWVVRFHVCERRSENPIICFGVCIDVILKRNEEIDRFGYIFSEHTEKCPAKNCKQLLTYTVDPEKCTGCTVCAKNCPSNAIDGERKTVHFIRQDACIKCGACFSKCKFDAILVS